MKRSMTERFKEVDRIPTPWDDAAQDASPTADRRTRSKVAALGLLAASLGVAVALTVIFVDREAARPAPDASWLLSETQASCVEQYSTETLPNRDWAFEGVIETVEGPADPHSEDPAQTTTEVTFYVARWFWGGSGKQVSLLTYTFPSSAGDVDESIGSHLLVSGDESFLWLCGFTQPFSERVSAEFETAAAARTGP